MGCGVYAKLYYILKQEREKGTERVNNIMLKKYNEGTTADRNKYRTNMQ